MHKQPNKTQCFFFSISVTTFEVNDKTYILVKTAIKLEAQSNSSLSHLFTKLLFFKCKLEKDSLRKNVKYSKIFKNFATHKSFNSN